ncbi:MAG: HAMP domain-containing sensor histidine kinase [Campylobacterota bacterium]|nr:HAMP domain-containing sensor histidine kinase [Campylobacterota bacterium]
MKETINNNLLQTITQQISEDKILSNDDVLELINQYQYQQKEQERILSQHSKLASMGEKIDFIAHQWKQPLNSLSLMSGLLKQDFQDGLISKEYIDDVTTTADTQINHLVATLHEFRTFLKPSKDIIESFLLHECVGSVQVLMRDELIINNIMIELDIEDNLSIEGESNEFKHIFLNLISNTIDVFQERKKLLSRHIYIRAFSKNSQIHIEFEDNAGGIALDIIDQVFLPHVTTKLQQGGSGVGLYMSSKIVEKYNASIKVNNSNIGALFTIAFNS